MSHCSGCGGSYIRNSTKLSSTECFSASHIDVEVKTINRLVNEKVSLTPDLAAKIAAALGTSVELWLNLQMQMNIWNLKMSKKKLPKLIKAA